MHAYLQKFTSKAPGPSAAAHPGCHSNGCMHARRGYWYSYLLTGTSYFITYPASQAPQPAAAALPGCVCIRAAGRCTGADPVAQGEEGQRGGGGRTRRGGRGHACVNQGNGQGQILLRKRKGQACGESWWWVRARLHACSGVMRGAGSPASVYARGRTGSFPPAHLQSGGGSSADFRP